MFYQVLKLRLLQPFVMKPASSEGSALTVKPHPDGLVTPALKMLLGFRVTEGVGMTNVGDLHGPVKGKISWGIGRKP